MQLLAINEHQLISVGADPDVGGTYLVLRPVTVINALAPVFGSLAQQVLAETPALRPLGIARAMVGNDVSSESSNV